MDAFPPIPSFTSPQPIDVPVLASMFCCLMTYLILDCRSDSCAATSNLPLLFHCLINNILEASLVVCKFSSSFLKEYICVFMSKANPYSFNKEYDTFPLD